MGLGAGQQLWIATHGAGLLNLDGRVFEQMRPDDAIARSLTAVLPLSTGGVVVGTEKAGALIWDGHSLRPLHGSLSGLHVSALAGSETDLWVGTIDRGLLHWHAGQLDHFTEADGLPDSRVLSLAVTSDGSAAYAGTAVGVAEFRNGRFTRTVADGVFANSLLLRRNTLAIGTFEEGVVELPLQAKQQRLRMRSEASAFGPVHKLLEIDDRLIVLAEDGLYANARRLFEVPGARLTDRNISALAVDRTGKLWVGYFDRGVDVIEPGYIRKTHFQDDHLFCVNRIMPENDRGLTAVATANGLVMFDSSAKPRRVLTKADGLISDNVTDILLRPDGRELAMTLATPAGITTIDSKGVSSLYAFHGLVNNHVYALASADSRLMAGTLGGLSMLDAGTVRANYTTANSGLKQNWITAIQRVADEWFVGTYGAGVVKLDSAGRWTTFPDLRGQIEVNANAMLVTSRAVYAGTLGNGLAVYGRASGRWSFLANGLPSDNVTALAFAAGELYIGTDNGLVRINEQQVPLP
ncbi:MAG: hypothetical protein JO022_06715 [Acidobacteriaceae bacterium]|nr:hypothetical protein [Acidobacteriaceae bacterium]